VGNVFDEQTLALSFAKSAPIKAPHANLGVAISMLRDQRRSQPANAGESIIRGQQFVHIIELITSRAHCPKIFGAWIGMQPE
jgi:hypothetical protein